MSDLEIMWTKVDEAPALATYSLLPIVKAFVGAAGVSVKMKDISLAGRILAQFPEKLTPAQRINDELTERGADPQFAPELAAARRAIRVRIGGQERWIGIEDAARGRDALGVALPVGVPEAYLGATADPLGDIVARYSRTRGPFTSAAAAKRFGLGVYVVDQALKRLAATGRVVAGDFDGDGWEDDIVALYDTGGDSIRADVFLSDGSDFSYQEDWWSMATFIPDNAAFRTVAGDVDGGGVGSYQGRAVAPRGGGSRVKAQTYTGGVARAGVGTRGARAEGRACRRGPRTRSPGPPAGTRDAPPRPRRWPRRARGRDCWCCPAAGRPGRAFRRGRCQVPTFPRGLAAMRPWASQSPWRERRRGDSRKIHCTRSNSLSQSCVTCTSSGSPETLVNIVANVPRLLASP